MHENALVIDETGYVQNDEIEFHESKKTNTEIKNNMNCLLKWCHELLFLTFLFFFFFYQTETQRKLSKSHSDSKFFSFFFLSNLQ